eukprot:1657565-Amphidinium_carterae.1
MLVFHSVHDPLQVTPSTIWTIAVNLSPVAASRFAQEPFFTMIVARHPCEPLHLGTDSKLSFGFFGAQGSSHLSYNGPALLSSSAAAITPHALPNFERRHLRSYDNNFKGHGFVLRALRILPPRQCAQHESLGKFGAVSFTCCEVERRWLW